MLQITTIKENPQHIIERLSVKNFDASLIIEQILQLDQKRRELQKNQDDALAETNRIAKEIGVLFQTGKQQEANELKGKTGELKEQAKIFGEALDQVNNDLNELIVQLPNLPHALVPRGRTAEDNEVVFTHGSVPELVNGVPHWDLCTKYDLIDFELGSKVSGAGFPFYKGKGARLQRALINFFRKY